MKFVLFVVTFVFGLTGINSSAAMVEPHLYAAPETVWVSNQGIQISTQDIELTPADSDLDLEFRSWNPKTLLERGDLSLQRKILLNASGTEITTDVFLWDLQLEVNYKFI